MEWIGLILVIPQIPILWSPWHWCVRPLLVKLYDRQLLIQFLHIWQQTGSRKCKRKNNEQHNIYHFRYSIGCILHIPWSWFFNGWMTKSTSCGCVLKCVCIICALYSVVWVLKMNMSETNWIHTFIGEFCYAVDKPLFCQKCSPEFGHPHFDM